MAIFFALLSSLSNGVFYLLDIWLADRQVYGRPAHAMVISSAIPFAVTLLAFPFISYYPTLPLGVVAFVAGAFMIWGNWFYFCVMFPSGERELATESGATELALYEGATPAIVLVLTVLGSGYLAVADNISAIEIALLLTIVICITLFQTISEQFSILQYWRTRVCVILFALLISVSQILQDQTLTLLGVQLEYTHWQSFVALAPWFGLGMSTGFVILLSRKVRQDFVSQWHSKIKDYVLIIIVAELIAIAAYLTLIRSYTEEHVAVAGAVAGTFPIIVFVFTVFVLKKSVANVYFKMLLTVCVVVCTALIFLQ